MTIELPSLTEAERFLLEIVEHTVEFIQASVDSAPCEPSEESPGGPSRGE